MQKLKRYISFMLVTIMVMGVSGTAFASEESNTGGNSGNTAGTVKLEGSINTDIYQVVMPTNKKGIFDFILDPQGLINKTNAAAYGDKKFEPDANVFFKRTDGKVKVDYSSESDAVTIVNKSSMPVDVTLDIKVSKEFLDGIELVKNKNFKKDTKASLYLALKDKEKELPIGKKGLSLKTTIAAAPDGAYEYRYIEKEKKYVYQLKDDISNIKFAKYSFQLTGAANGKGDWTKLSDNVPGVEVTWKVVPKKGESKRKDAILNYDMASAGSGEEETEPGETPIQQPGTAEQTESKTKETTSGGEENEVKSEGKAPSVIESSYTLEDGKPVSVKVDLGVGDAAAKKVVSVRRKDSGEELLDVSDSVQYKDGKVLFSAEWVDGCIADEASLPAVLIIGFDDTVKTEAEIALKK